MEACRASRVDDHRVRGTAGYARTAKTLLDGSLELVNFVIEGGGVDTCAVVPEHRLDTELSRRNLLLVVGREREHFAHADATATIGGAVAGINRCVVEQFIGDCQRRIDPFGFGNRCQVRGRARYQRATNVLIVLAITQAQSNFQAVFQNIRVPGRLSKRAIRLRIYGRPRGTRSDAVGSREQYMRCTGRAIARENAPNGGAGWAGIPIAYLRPAQKAAVLVEIHQAGLPFHTIHIADQLELLRVLVLARPRK
ncbi:conserved hypothetical protein [Ricinus communis]|uniref:Uncharacterized protein n=1 Tax=Ricinus communis TaxID=3988 RepID=B9TL02_RICCO|nr:conserved hypothetical protein [Ricinus communis]